MNPIQSTPEVVTAEVAAVEGVEFAAPLPAQSVGVLNRQRRRVDGLAQRGMVTAEYAVGILAAIALALVLLRVFNDNRFFQLLFDQVTKLIGQIGGSVAKGR